MERFYMLVSLILVFVFAIFFFVTFNSNESKVALEEPLILEEPPRLASYNVEDLTCLAKNIYYEARSEPIEGQLAVAIITLNRVNHQDFPNNICDVVYEKNKRGVCQFSWTCQTRYPVRNMEAFTTAIEVARLAIERKSDIDLLSKALYYHADYVNPRWNHKTKVIKIGRHIFYEYDRV
jgi:spore germination cell wall hydrolase CwlJ-like protein